jgi:hypothetical protein
VALENQLVVDGQKIIEFECKLEGTTNRMRDGNSSEEDLMVLIQSRGERPAGMRARQLTKQ